MQPENDTQQRFCYWYCLCRKHICVPFWYHDDPFKVCGKIQKPMESKPDDSVWFWHNVTATILFLNVWTYACALYLQYVQYRISRICIRNSMTQDMILHLSKKRSGKTWQHDRTKTCNMFSICPSSIIPFNQSGFQSSMIIPMRKTTSFAMM